MKWHLLTLFLFFLLLGACFADGIAIMPPDYTEKVFMPEQKAVIFWDGTTEQLIIESKITLENVGNVAWLVPIESSTKPEIETADADIFFSLSDLFAPKPKSSDLGLWQTMGASKDSVPQVQVVEQLELDIYDITVLRTTNETALIQWLNQNGYSFPNAFPNLLSQYVQSGNFYFIANKIDLENKYPGIEPSTKDFECAQTLSDLDEIRYNYYYGSRVEDRIPDMMYYEDVCEGADQDAVTALVQLRLGIATPLKITFTPQKPFYPMKVSSLNLGEGKALVYFVSNAPYKDSTGLFSGKAMLAVKTTGLSEHGINNGDYVTMLSWQNQYPTLEHDSFFEQTAFVPELDPNYVPPLEALMDFLAPLLFVLVLLGIVSIPLIVIPFLLGFAIACIFQKSKKKKGFWAESNGIFAWIFAAVLVLLGPIYLIVTVILPALFFGGRANIEWFLDSLIFMALFLLPYFASMAFGFLFRHFKHKKIWLLGPLAIFAAVLLFLFFFSLIFGSFIY